MTKATLASLSSQIATEADAYRYFEELRWDGTPKCAHCDSENVYLIGCANGISRKTRTGNMSQRRVWKCRDCKRQFSVITGTVMQSTKVPVRVWAMVTFEMCASKNGTAAREIERKYGVCPRTAWFMLHRIRAAMAGDGFAVPMQGTIVSDETWVGGEPRWRHASDRRNQPRRIAPGTEHRSLHTDKTPVLSLLNTETGEVRSRVVPNVNGHTLRKVIADQVNMSASDLLTDEGGQYLHLGREFASHQTVNHQRGEYVRDGVTTNRIEGFFAQLKRSIDGTHHHVSEEHLQRYLGEFDFRYTTCHLSDAERVKRLAAQVGQRLTYKTTKAA